MAATIQVNRGNFASLPTLADGEFYFATDTNQLFIGDPGGNREIEAVKNNFAATAAPGTGDDSGDGYSVGSKWIDVTGDDAYICVDATLGAAVWIQMNGGGGSGTVTSVGLTVPSFLSVSGSPVTTSGTLAVTLATQAANRIFSGPASGADAVPTFRAQVVADLPLFNGLGTITGLLTGDFVPFYEAASGANKKVSREDLANSLQSLTPIFLVYPSATKTISHLTFTKVDSNTEVVDSNGFHDNATNYRFTPTHSGYYLLFGLATLDNLGATSEFLAAFYKNGSEDRRTLQVISPATDSDMSTFGATIMQFNGSTDYAEFFVRHSHGSNRTLKAGPQETFWGGFHIK